jgi:glyoxylase-like metal-dependent hydrolase (beta-lactamase superfamily II)
MMMRTRWVAFALVVALAGCSRATPEQQVVNDAAEALGGAAQIQAVNTLVMTGEGTQYNLGQDVGPGASGQTFTVTGYTRTIDVAGGRARTELTRQPNFAFFQGPAPQRQVQGIEGDVAYNVAANGTANRAAGTAASERQLEILHHPVTALRAALAEGSMLSNSRTENGRRMVDVTTAAGQTFTLTIGADNLPVMVSHRAANPNLGDVVISTTFANYRAVNGLQLPAQLTVKTDDFTTAESRLTHNAVNGDAGDLAAPAAARNAEAPAGPPPVNVTAEVLSPGIWLLGGGSHHSVLVEFNDHLTLIETPQNEARALAVIAKARETVPGKPLTQVVNTHHHFDHSGGIRTAMSEGLTVITHEGNVAFYREVAKRPSTVTPDALQTNRREATVEGVGAEGRVLTDGTMTVNLSPVTTAHSETMLMAYVPRDRMLIEADVYTPGAAAQSYAAAFLQQIREQNLRVDRIIPLHGQPAPFAQLVKEAAASAPATN